MKAAVITFPGSNCDRDLATAFARAGAAVTRVWHKETDLPAGTDIVGVPGGFSYGDYLRCGAIAAQSPVARAIADFAGRGGMVIGVCNGFQVLTEMRLLPGVLMRNAGLKFVCKPIDIVVKTTQSPYTNLARKGDCLTIPVAHHDGNYTIDAEGLKRLHGEDRIAFAYRDNPNGSMDGIAGVLSENRRVLGLMPHPERAFDATSGGQGGSVIFRSILAAMAPA